MAGKNIQNLYDYDVPGSLSIPGATVVFNTIYSSDWPKLVEYAATAANTLEQIDAKLHPALTQKSKNVEQVGQEILDYIKLIQSSAQKSRDNEMAFIQDQIQLLNSIPEATKSKSINNLQQALDDFLKAEGNFQYLKFIDLINQVMQDESQYKDILTEQKARMETVQTNFDQLQEWQQYNLEQDFYHYYESYKKESSELLLKTLDKQIKNDQNSYKKLYMDSMTDKINSMLQSIASNGILLNNLEQTFMNSGVISQEQIYNTILNLIVQQAQKTPILDDAIDNVISTLNKSITNKILPDFQNSQISGVFSQMQKDNKTLEELALRKENNFRELANALLQLAPAEQRKAISQYGTKANKLKKIYDDLITAQKTNAPITQIRYQQSLLTRTLGLAIQKSIKGKLIYQKLPHTSFEDIKKNAAQFYQSRNLAQGLQGRLQVTKLSGPSKFAEIFAQQDVINQIRNAILSNAPGSVINLKDDIVFSVGFDINNFTTDDDVIEKLINDYNEKIADAWASYLPEYKQNWGGATNVDVAEKKYLEKIKNLLDQFKIELQKNIKDADEQSKILERIKHSFLGSISVKNYVYNNRLGYHGGSLGGNAETVMNNISRMYELGGITPIQGQELLFAVLNCTSATIGDSSIKQHIADYLLGGAALMMFDEGFSSVPGYLQKWQDSLLGTSVRGIELYALNGVYVPSSYILETVYQNLLGVYSQLTQNFKTTADLIKNSHNKVIIKEHGLTAQNSNPYETPLAQDRWEEMGAKAAAATSIQFIFMSGMLDIVEGLAAAHNIT